jgi:hypothetical protein
MPYQPVLSGILTNDWVNWVLSTYSIVLALIPTVLIALAKLAAIFNPNVPENKILDWIREIFYKKELLAHARKKELLAKYGESIELDKDKIDVTKNEAVKTDAVIENSTIKVCVAIDLNKLKDAK